MKKILLLTTLAAGSFLFAATNAAAQVSVSVNIGMQPAWGPAGYDYAEYYYLPEVEAYYSVPRRQFVYFDRGSWVFAAGLPGRCGNYDLYSGYKVVINERDPWCHFNNHRVQYAPYRYRHDQVMIRDGRGGRGGYYDRPGYGNRDDRGRNRDWSYNNSNGDRRDGRGRDDDRRYDNNRRERNDRDDRRENRHEDNRGGRGRGRW
jgi:hypothetical protein